jgi:hypothetical protein
MKNEVKKKMMMREHRIAVRKSPKHNVRLENQRRHSSLTIAETLSFFSSVPSRLPYAPQIRVHGTAQRDRDRRAFLPVRAAFPPLAHL